MKTLRDIALAAFGFAVLSVPIAAYSGYYAPTCANAMVWTPSGYHEQYICN